MDSDDGSQLGEARVPDESTVTSPTRDLSASFQLTARPGDRIGRYKVLEQIGEGGCGVVFVAEQQEPIRRKVALKVIKLGMDTRQVIARFEAERQALALMDHANIAKVLDAGATDTGRPFFVMELVRGIKITEYCDQNKLPTGERLSLFIQVCQAVQHAHQKGVIHRDLKPSNILVTLHDGAPVPKVIDFGIAKATTDLKLTDKTVYTALEQFIGTPAYMSPEQAEMSGLDIDTRTDIYSLGVLLYELITGETPFDSEQLLAQGLEAMRRVLREKEPARPSTRLSTMFAANLSSIAQAHQSDPLKLVKLVRGDLDWIVMKCLEKDRTRRYETANGLAFDLQRHLNNEPVFARPPSKLYEFQKTVRRHKVGFAATVAIIIALATGVVLATWQAVLAKHAKAEADHAATTAIRTTKLLQDMIATAHPFNGNGIDYTVREMLEGFAPKLITSVTNEPEVEASLLFTVGDVLYWLEQRNQSNALFGKDLVHRSLKLRGQLYGTNSEIYADTLLHYCWMQDPNRVNDAKEAIKIYRQQGIGGAKLIDALSVLQAMYNKQRQWAESERVVAEAELEARKTPGIEYPAMAGLYHDLVEARMGESNYSSAEEVARKSISLHIRSHGPNHPHATWGWLGLGRALHAERHHFREALAADRKALEILRHTYSGDSSMLQFPLDEIAGLLRDAEDPAWARNAVSPDDNLSPSELQSERVLAQQELKTFMLAFANNVSKVGGPPGENEAAWILATSSLIETNDLLRAVQWAEGAVTATKRTNPEYLDTLAAAYAAVGEYPKAIKSEREAIALLPDGGPKKDLNSRLTLYESNRPYRESP
jgi:serine/threonine protein kinase